ncbi:MAG: hypothetical protein CVV64_12930 [Candidatus Wallbacteria bacterium HGW-Wallbacteria-1]|jgi:uncharacterized protein YebE (UPF0316 family)|uniref:UPF0316 protein CVV64_12930 n=1 Tax=Candidatus Wallbacteria bacterium HGW-Wallbacteria-1 TaxID=2013854 RepID=A0A2N1PMX2_9BACT|nr:MAG: hypothetical protein CVV64_12930 [Candidatus Wallbacteria bacterium HGW-Wallbacteria-1]
MSLIPDNPILLSLLIVLARIADVSLGTVRTIMVFRGYRALAAVIGFFEILIWITAAGKVLTNLNEWYLVVSYAGGFAIGNYTGIWIEAKLAMGVQLVRVVSENTDIHMADILRARGYTVTSLPAFGRNGSAVEILLVVEKRRDVPKLLEAIAAVDENAFFTIEDIKTAHRAIFNGKETQSAPGILMVAKKK